MKFIVELDGFSAELPENVAVRVCEPVLNSLRVPAKSPFAVVVAVSTELESSITNTGTPLRPVAAVVSSTIPLKAIDCVVVGFAGEIPSDVEVESASAATVIAASPLDANSPDRPLNEAKKL